MARRRRAIAVGSACAVIALVVVLILLLSESAPSAQRPVARPAPTPAPRKAGPLRSPFTGERVSSLGRVLAVKIDNIVYARPQTGLRSADIVYVLPVEGGLSRFMAVFSSHLPAVIGPVRSSREDDLELLAQFGHPAFAYSGAAPHLLPFVHRAPIVDLYAGTANGYFRSPDRIAPYNLYARSADLMKQARQGGASVARDIGFRFSDVPPPDGHAASSFAAGYPSASFTFRWSGTQHRWLVWMDGTRALDMTGGAGGGQLGGATVVIQYTTVRTSRFLEYGSRPPYADSTGSGHAVVLRDGRSYHVTWSRPSASGGTVYTLPDGQRMTFARGQVWVLLTASSLPTVIRTVNPRPGHPRAALVSRRASAAHQVPHIKCRTSIVTENHQSMA